MKLALSLLTVSIAWVATPVTADDLQAAADDICKCGFPPSSACFDELATKYQEINASPSLQDEVMRMAQAQCGPTQRDIANMVGNDDLQLDKLPAGVASALAGISTVVTDTADCSTADFRVSIPDGWQCRKQTENPLDVTLHTSNNTLNVSLGRNQGKTSCDVIPVCQSAPASLGTQFDTTLFTNPIVKTFEYAGAHRDSGGVKLTITAIREPSGDEMADIAAILDSVVLQ